VDGQTLNSERLNCFGLLRPLGARYRDKQGNAFSRANVDLSTMTAEPAGAALIESAFGSRPGSRFGTRDAEAVVGQIFANLSAAKLRKSGSRVDSREHHSHLLWWGGAGDV